MDKIQSIINEGILMEENFIPFISGKMSATQGFTELEENKKNRILSLLAIHKKDTERHKTALEKIYNLYQNE